ncbi:ATP-binding protein [Streptomyces sp. NPDC056638]|uniref:ATP-binding protein n=1 Tax=Streptomyces sp. NPDC056638 TaxID=3345887 RepID=UPI0036A2C5C3
MRNAWARPGLQLTLCGLAGLLFTTELIVSELLTNAIHYGRPLVELRLIGHDVLVGEVTESNSTQPCMRRARTTDEGGRGLFLVAQLGARWGCRHSQNGKTIWSKQLVSWSVPASRGGSCWDQRTNLTTARTGSTPQSPSSGTGPIG